MMSKTNSISTHYSLPVVEGDGFAMCRVWNAEGVECRALYGSSGAMGEPESFFSPKQFKASDIVKWEPLEENSPTRPHHP